MDINEISEFHQKRIAFMIIEDEIIFLENSPMSHREWFNTLKLNLDFETVIRGFYFDHKIVFYKGDFIYDKETIKVAKEYYDTIVKRLDLNHPQLWCGQNKKETIKPITDPWEPMKRIF